MNIDDFPWESEEQKKSYLALVQYSRQFGFPDHRRAAERMEFDPLAAFIFQKLHEGTEWWRDTLIEQVNPVKNQVGEMAFEVQNLRDLVEQMQETIANQRLAIDAILKSK